MKIFTARYLDLASYSVVERRLVVEDIILRRLSSDELDRHVVDMAKIYKPNADAMIMAIE